MTSRTRDCVGLRGSLISLRKTQCLRMHDGRRNFWRCLWQCRLAYDCGQRSNSRRTRRGSRPGAYPPMAASWRSLDLKAKLENAAGALAGFSTTDRCRLFLPLNLQQTAAGERPFQQQATRQRQPNPETSPAALAASSAMCSANARLAHLVQRDHRPAGRGKTSQDDGQWRQRRVSRLQIGSIT